MIKRLLSLIVFVLALYDYSHSQNSTDDSSSLSDGSIRFGVRAGGIYNTFNHAQPGTSENFGIGGSFLAEKPISGKISIQGELSYLQQGGTYTRFTDNTVPGDLPFLAITSSRINAQYGDLALLAKYQITQIDKIIVNVTVGGAFGYNIGVINKYERTYYDSRMFYTTYGKQMITHLFQPFQVGAVGGLGTEVGVGSKRLLIDFRYRYGLTPAMKSFSYIDLPTVKGDLYTNSFYIMIGLGL